MNEGSRPRAREKERVMDVGRIMEYNRREWRVRLHVQGNEDVQCGGEEGWGRAACVRSRDALEEKKRKEGENAEAKV